MPKRQSFFHKPQKAGEMVGSRRVLAATNPTLVDVIDSMRPGQAVVVGFDIIPAVDPITGIPYYKEEDSEHKSIRFLKRGPQVGLRTYETIEDAMNAAVQPYVERNRRFKDISHTIPYSGYGWWGIRVRQHKKVHLVDCVNGTKIFAFSMQNAHDDSRQITFGEYNSDNTRNENKDMGGDFIFEVPSTTDDFKHDVTFYSVPIERGRQKFARVRDLWAVQSSKAVTKRVTKRYKGREMYFGKHAIAAYISLAKSETEKGNPIPIEMCPFALPTQKTVDFYNRLETKVMMKETYLDEKGRKRTKKRPLNKAEKEILLWRFVAKYGPQKTFFARGKIQDYRWHRCYEPNRAA